MNLNNALKYCLLLLLVASTPGYAGDGSSPETYSFQDDATGLGIELPKKWERRDPNEIKRVLIEKNEAFWKKPAPDALNKAGVIFLAFASPYAGPEKDRPFLSCIGTPIPPEKKDIPPSQVKVMLDMSIQSTFGRYERDVTISEASRVDISGKEAYRISALKKNNAPGSVQLVGLLVKDRLVICSGGHDSTFKADVERALASLSFK